jgi:Chalcone isomerase-like
MSQRVAMAASLVLCLTAGAYAAHGVDVGTAHFADTTSITMNGKPVNLTLTGAAMRVKLFVNVYAIGSYVQAGTTVRSAAELSAADVPKQLHLVMQRDVAGRDVAESFRAAIRANYPEPAFNAEVDSLVRMLREGTARRGEEILLTHLPGVGLQVNVTGKEPFVINNAGFSKAVWDIYLGNYNVGDAVKRGLVSNR